MAAADIFNKFMCYMQCTNRNWHSARYMIIKDNVIAQFKIVLHSSSSSSSSGLHLKMIQYHKYMPYHNKPDKIKYKSSKFDQKKSQI
ncbi:hypothetical protein T12_2315 [Trichinella patagoniensis]|uniref:Uncharacterized protein n=1 Tax=Trichinella patagoniensis TaxID=990121 RepID=A0A0V0ZKL4_9BILA|nr:hypothetical protein T12_2315 [Trichinella patagoniensis]